MPYHTFELMIPSGTHAGDAGGDMGMKPISVSGAIGAIGATARLIGSAPLLNLEDLSRNYRERT